jgi:hypothetical protein
MSTGVGLGGAASKVVQVKLPERSKACGLTLIGFFPIRAGPGWAPFHRSVPGGQCRVRGRNTTLLEYTVHLYCTVYSSCAVQTGITLTTEEGGREGSSLVLNCTNGASFGHI